MVFFSADQQAQAKTRHLAPCDLVRKPFDPDDLVAAVRRGLAAS
jgi:DNA-binding response OmpR family regulator